MYWDFEEDNAVKSVRQTSQLFATETLSVFGTTNTHAGSDGSSPSKKEAISLIQHQTSIPRLPVPTLQETCSLYLKSLEGIANSEEYSRAAQTVSTFLESEEASRLQQLLVERDGKQDQPSWLEEYWDDAYLYTRDPVPININYFFGFERAKPHHSSQIGRASALLHAAVDFYITIRDQTLPHDTDRGAPLCMSQFRRVFCSSRIPGETRDKIITYTTSPLTPDEQQSRTTLYEHASPRHCIVIARNRFFKVNVLADDGSALPLLALAEALARVVKTVHADGQQSGPPVGVLTTMDRTDWFHARELLHDRNAHSLALIQSAILVLCLDNLVVEDDAEAARMLLHGAGTNRWFDRHNLIVSQNGVAGLNFEHSVGDGITTLRVADSMHKYEKSHALRDDIVAELIQKAGIIEGSTSSSSSRGRHQGSNSHDAATEGPIMSATASVDEVVWNLDSTIDNIMKTAYDDFREQIQMNETQVLAFKHFGGNLVKQNKLSPDAFVQIAFQLTYFRLFGRNDATYEAASTRGFLHGRTETVRSSTRAAADFCRTMKREPIFDQKVGSTIPTARQLLFRAGDAHVEYMKLAKAGKGVDRHLYGLRILAKVNRIELPDMFSDPLLAKSSHWSMSTSHCGSSALNLFGFGPVVADGFGLGYMIKNDEIDVVITSKYTHRFISSSIFKSILESSLLEMKSLLECDVRSRKEKATTVALFTHPTAYSDFDYEPTRGFVYKVSCAKKSLYRQRSNSANMPQSTSSPLSPPQPSSSS